MISIWSDSIEFPSFEQLKKDIKTDVLIIGGGITGILCAYMLEQAGIDYVLVEADELCSGITKNTTAKISIQHGLIYHKLVKRFGLEMARMYLDANVAALQEYRKLCESIDCHFEAKDSLVYSLNSPTKLEKELHALNQLGYTADYVGKLPIPLANAGAVRFENQAQFHPLKFLAEISKDLSIYEHTKVRELMPNTAMTAHGRITAQNIIVTTHFPFLNKHGSYFLKMYQHRSYVIAYENTPDVKGMYVDEADKGLSFRNYDNLLLIGGGDHRTGKHGGNWKEISEFATAHYPDAQARYYWATQDCMTLDGMPYIGPYSAKVPHVLVATGYEGWGMVGAMSAARILTEHLMGREHLCQGVFTPQRALPLPKLAANGMEAAMDLLTPIPRRCPHLGCALRFNSVERTWDCPCHGSRFGESGELLHGPAQRPLDKEG